MKHRAALTSGSRWLHSHQPLLKALSDGVYLALTTAIGLRTLGEEYTDIYQLADSHKPSTLRRVGYVLAESIGAYTLTYILWPRVRRRLQEKLETAIEHGRQGLRNKLLQAALAVVENTSSMHLALFYFLGTYYSLPKRLFRIKYVSSSVESADLDHDPQLIPRGATSGVRTAWAASLLPNHYAIIPLADIKVPRLRSDQRPHRVHRLRDATHKPRPRGLLNPRHTADSRSRR
jgi:Pex2 / Pex12 amino terminal region